MRKEKLSQIEGLFITEFSEDFFQSELAEEERRDIERLSEEVQERRRKKSKEKIWHSIFAVIIEDIMSNGLAEKPCYPGKEESEFKKMLKRFYTDPFLVEMDIAQKIRYNLERLGEDVEYDIAHMEDIAGFENDFRDLIAIGRNVKNKTIDQDLLEDIGRLEIRRKAAHAKSICNVYMPAKTEDGIIRLESSFEDLNMAFIANESFQDYLYNKERKQGYFSVLETLAAKLNDGRHITPILYIWEKMTNLNTISVISKFLSEYILWHKYDIRTSAERKYCICDFVKRWKPLLHHILAMPNVLTRLLILNEAFDYIERDQFCNMAEHLEELEFFLGRVDRVYQSWQDEILKVAVKVRWQLYHQEIPDIADWIDELDEEYSWKMLAKMMFTQNIRNKFYIGPVRDQGIYEDKYVEKNEGYDFKEENFVYKDILEKRPWEAGFLDDVGDAIYIEENSKLADILYRKGWCYVDTIIENIAKAEQEEGNVQEEIYIGGKLVCTELPDMGTAERSQERFKTSAEELDGYVKQCQLSQYKDVMLDNLKFRDQRLYIKIISFLLYHIYI